MERKIQLLSKHTLLLTTHKPKPLRSDPLLHEMSTTSYHRTLDFGNLDRAKDLTPSEQFWLLYRCKCLILDPKTEDRNFEKGQSLSFRDSLQKKKKRERINKGQRPFCWKQGSHLIIFTSKSKDRRGKIRQASPFTRKPIFRHCHSGSTEILLMELVFGESSFHQNWHSLNLNY